MHITRLLCLNQNFDNVLKWSKIVAKEKPRRRAVFITLLIKSGVYLLTPSEEVEQYIDQFNLLTPKKYYVPRLFFFLLAIKRNVGLDYIFVGFTLANKYKNYHHFNTFFNALPPSIEAIEKVVSYIKKSENYSEWFPIYIWEGCGVLEGFIDVISTINWQSLPINTAYRYIKLYLDIKDYDLNKEQLRLMRFYIVPAPYTKKNLLMC
jgi:hypothetical protein